VVTPPPRTAYSRESKWLDVVQKWDRKFLGVRLCRCEFKKFQAYPLVCCCMGVVELLCFSGPKIEPKQQQYDTIPATAFLEGDNETLLELRAVLGH